MNKKLCKLIMELIFIFIIPLVVIACSFQRVKTYEYDENNNVVSEDWKLDWEYPFNDYKSDEHYVNYLKYNQLVQNSNNETKNEYGFDYICENDNYYYIVGTPTQNLTSYIVKYVNISQGHKYLLKTNVTGTTQSSSKWQIYTSGVRTIYEANNNIFTANTNGLLQIYVALYANQSVNISFSLNLIDLSDMFGFGYEPTTYNEYSNYNIKLNNYSYNEEETIIYYSENTNISENWIYNYSPWGSIINLLINNLYLEDTLVLRVIITYTILWFIMFILWHLLYRFVDFMVHLFDKKE